MVVMYRGCLHNIIFSDFCYGKLAVIIMRSVLFLYAYNLYVHMGICFMHGMASILVCIYFYDYMLNYNEALLTLHCAIICCNALACLLR